MRIILNLILAIFPLSSFCFHIWTTIIAFSEGGFWGGVLTFVIPVLSELYWMVKMWDTSSTYTIVCIIHLIGVFIYMFFGRGRE